MNPMRSARSEGLRDDQRGAILLIATFMAAFMCGCLWYLMGIGESIIYRERLQDGADAAAYANAVYHARGMNIIAMINLVMASHWAVLMALKATEILAWMLFGIVSALCACCGMYCEYVGPSEQFAQKMSDVAVPQTEQTIKQVLKMLSAKQVSIAKMVPHRGAQRAAQEAKDYKRDVEHGQGFSVSQQPNGARLGLPVQEDDMQELCDRAATVALTMAVVPLPSAKDWGGGGKMPLPAGLVAGAAPGVIQMLKMSMCGGGTGSSAKAEAKKGAKLACELQAKAAEKANKSFDLGGCLADIEKNFPEGAAGAAQAGGGQNQGMTPKRIYDPAENGDDFFQTFAITVGDSKQWYKRSDKGVEMAAWGQAKVDENNAKADLQRYALTMAEFYYDTSGSWEDYADDALWNLRWRARLRRVRKPIGGPIPPEAQKVIPYIKDMVH